MPHLNTRRLFTFSLLLIWRDNAKYKSVKLGVSIELAWLLYHCVVIVKFSSHRFLVICFPTVADLPRGCFIESTYMDFTDFFLFRNFLIDIFLNNEIQSDYTCN
jgi:hypothetical protein